MDQQDTEWQAVGEAIADRIDELGLTLAELERASGVSFKSLQRYIGGHKIVRRDKARDLAAALGWAPDAFDRIRADKDPVPLIGDAARGITTAGAGPLRSMDPYDAASLLAYMFEDLDLADQRWVIAQVSRLWSERVHLDGPRERAAGRQARDFALAAESGGDVADAEHGDDVSDRPRPEPMTGDEGA